MLQQIEALGLFPLSDVVLLPELSVPLYIFEPRYRQMTQDALAGSHQIGMVTVRPEAVADIAGDPAIFAVGCLGRIAQAQKRPDGTFQMLLLGERRFRVLDEHAQREGRLYRSARVELLEDLEPTNAEARARLDTSRAQVLEQITRLVERSRLAESSSTQLGRFASLEAPRLINVLTQAIGFEPIEKQQLLEADSILARFEIMADLLRFRIAQTSGLERPTNSLPN